ncbi:hypothetical protein, partial [Akkermansia sp.]
LHEGFMLFKAGCGSNFILFHFAGSGNNAGGPGYLFFPLPVNIGRVRWERRNNKTGKNNQ